MINPVHRMKKFVRYAGNEKPTTFYVTDVDGWLGSGALDCNGKEIFEGDIVKIYYVGNEVCDTLEFDSGGLYLDGFPLIEFDPEQLEVVGHIATEGKA